MVKSTHCPSLSIGYLSSICLSTSSLCSQTTAGRASLLKGPLKYSLFWKPLLRMKELESQVSIKLLFLENTVCTHTHTCLAPFQFLWTFPLAMESPHLSLRPCTWDCVPSQPLRRKVRGQDRPSGDYVPTVILTTSTLHSTLHEQPIGTYAH